MACAAAAVHKKKPQSRLLALLQTAQPVRALAGPTVRAALFDPRTPAFWLSRCSSRPSTSSSISTGPHRQLRPLRVSPRRAVQASEPSESEDDKDKIVASARDEQLQKTAQEKEDKGFDEPTEQDTLSQKLLEMAVKTWDGAQKDLDGAREDLDGAREDRDFARQRFREAVQNGDEKERKEAREEFEKAKGEFEKAKEEAKRAESKVQAAKEEATKAREELEKAKSTAPLQDIKKVTPEDFQPLAMIPRPGVPIEDWMVELTTCADECVNIIRALAVQSDTGADRVPPLMLSRCTRGGKTTLLAHLFDKVKDIENYSPIFISFNCFSGIQPRSGENRLQTLLRAIAVTLLQPSASTDAQSVSCDEGTLTDYLDSQKGVIVLMIDELNLLLPKGTRDDKVACFLRKVFLIPANRYLVFTTHWPIGDQVAEYTGSISPRGVRTAAMPMSLNVTQQRCIPGCETLALGEVLFFSGIPSLLRCSKNHYDFRARFTQLSKPLPTRALLRSFVRQFLEGDAQEDDSIRTFDHLTTLSKGGVVKWVLCYAAQMCIYLGKLKLGSWFSMLELASEDGSGKAWEILIALAVSFRCLESMFSGEQGDPLLGLPPTPGIQECYFADVPPEIRTLDAALQWWRRQRKPQHFPFALVLLPLCPTFQVFDCILVYQETASSCPHIRGFKQKAGDAYPDEHARANVSGVGPVSAVWMQGKAPETRLNPQNKGWTMPTAKDISRLLGTSLRDLFPRASLDT